MTGYVSAQRRVTRYERMKTMTRSEQARKGRKQQARKVKFPGIVADAQALGCHRVHLFEVLTGRRTSHILKERYYEMKKGGRP